jgi:hypothetical protein
VKHEYDYGFYADLLSDVTCQDVKVIEKKEKRTSIATMESRNR